MTTPRTGHAHRPLITVARIAPMESKIAPFPLFLFFNFPISEMIHVRYLSSFLLYLPSSIWPFRFVGLRVYTHKLGID